MKGAVVAKGGCRISAKGVVKGGYWMIPFGASGTSLTSLEQYKNQLCYMFEHYKIFMFKCNVFRLHKCS